MRKDLNALRQQHHTLQQAYDRRLHGIGENGGTNPQKAPALQLAELIIENSPAVLFRRLAAENPKERRMVYVSPNIARFGYRAEDFLSGRIMFRDILYAEDFDRTLSEIASFARRNIEAYTQEYRIVTRDGEVRWVEDRTSVVEDSLTGRRYHQGIVIDIHRRKAAEEKLQERGEVSADRGNGGGRLSAAGPGAEDRRSQLGLRPHGGVPAGRFNRSKPISKGYRALCPILVRHGRVILPSGFPGIRRDHQDL